MSKQDIKSDKSSVIPPVKPFGQLPLPEIFAAFKTNSAERCLIFDVEPKAQVAGDASSEVKLPEKEPFTQPIFSENPIPVKFDVQQGAIGDCYFLATVASILQQPNGAQLIAGCMRDLSEPYQLSNGEYTTLGKALGLVDDQKILVRFFASQSVAYALVDKSEIIGDYRAQSPLYIQILEKAYAGIFKEQDMKHLGSGEPRFVMDSFLGEESSPAVRKVASLSEKELCDVLNSQSLKVINTKKEIGKAESKGVAGEAVVDGLAAAHAYAVEGGVVSRQFSKNFQGREYAQQHTGVMVFNPWGYDELSSGLICGMDWRLEVKQGALFPRASLQASPTGSENASSWLPLSAIKEKTLEVCYTPFDAKKDYAQQLSDNAMQMMQSQETLSLEMTEPSLMDYRFNVTPAAEHNPSAFFQPMKLPPPSPKGVVPPTSSLSLGVAD